MISVLDTGIANCASVLYALERLGMAGTLTQNPDMIRRSSHVILPGVGSARALMQFLDQAQLISCLLDLDQPILGICLGMQILYENSEEGPTRCLGKLPGSVRKLKAQRALPVPQMGWNQLKPSGQPNLLLKDISEREYFYFVHSFYAPEGSEVKATTDYGQSIPALIESGNLFGTQFHPERSGSAGEKVLRNFLSL